MSEQNTPTGPRTSSDDVLISMTVRAKATERSHTLVMVTECDFFFHPSVLKLPQTCSDVIALLLIKTFM